MTLDPELTAAIRALTKAIEAHLPPPDRMATPEAIAKLKPHFRRAEPGEQTVGVDYDPR